MTRTWRAAGMSVAAYAPQHAQSPGLAEFLKLASPTESQVGPLTIVLDGLEACSNPEEFARAAIALAQDGHTVVVGCRRSVLPLLPDASMLLVPEESLRFSEPDFVSRIRAEVPTAVRRKLDEKRGKTWLGKAFEASEGLALYTATLIQRLSEGSLQPEAAPPKLGELWDRMLSDAGALDDTGQLAPLLLVGKCQLSWAWEDKVLPSFLGTDPLLVLPLIVDFLDASGRPFHSQLREFVLNTPRLARTRELARERWLSTAFANPMEGWTDLPALAQVLDAHEEGWRRLVEGGAFLPWLMRDSFVSENLVSSLANWTQLAGAKTPMELRAWLSILRTCTGCDWGTSVSPHRTQTRFGDWFIGSTADFILDRVYEQTKHPDLAHRALGALSDVDVFRPCRRVNPAAALPVRFQFAHDVIGIGIGSDGHYLATLGPDGELSVDSIADGHRHLQSFATGVIAETVWLAVSDKLQAAAIGHDGAHSEITVVQFKEQPPQVERYAWGNGGYVRLGSAVAGGAAPTKVFAMPHGLLAYLEGHANPHDVDEAARDQYIDPTDSAEYEYNEAADLTARRPLDGESSVVEVHRGYKQPVKYETTWRPLLAVDGHVLRFRGKHLSVYDLEGVRRHRESAGMVFAPPPGPFHFASDKNLIRIVCDGAGVHREAVATYVRGEKLGAEGEYQVLLRDRKTVWIDPDGVECAPQWPASVVSTLHCEVDDNHLVVRDASGNVVADWWGRVALYTPVMLRADRVAVLEGDALVVLSIDLPS